MSRLVERCRAFRAEVLAERESLRAERESLREQLTAKIAEMTSVEAARDRLRAFVDTPEWGEMDSGAAISEGDIVRYGVLRYRARTGHTKALTRIPLNILYWEVVTDDGI